jgi:3-hydroxyacyl-[acyl-carrier-protein] dehydratase
MRRGIAPSRRSWLSGDLPRDEETRSRSRHRGHLVTSHESLDSTAIAALLAHRFPFLLVDRIDIIVPGQHVIGHKMISVDEWCFEGLTPPLGTFAFSLVIEAMAQTSGALMRDLAGVAGGTVAYFMGVNRVRLRQAPRTGDEIRMDVTLRLWRRGLCRAHGIATVDGRLVASAALTTVVRGGG